MSRGGQAYRIQAGLEPYHARSWEPTHTLDQQVALARAEMGEDRWARANSDWAETDRLMDEAFARFRQHRNGSRYKAECHEIMNRGEE